ncbi:MAG: hypothetical protein OM95_07130 [Bdellovibrio sp. ArHS]|uniref:hypothetical protein n=1 Tax=Bdellovibrio sp. ArHS TaxID=1569284 RepID=UPI000582EB9B|nr:hypothetical protein [Bdellovibrio sp. ArHS]KHD88881.1 MAG: hypothetical protein OM95_07130 [Bdellovibrio sp. ArHS]
MRALLFALISLSVSSSMAVTRGQYLGMQMIINIASVSYDGTVDGSPQELFLAMDRPEQDSILGRGKALEAPQKVLNFICAKKGENNYQCSIYIHKSNVARIGPGKAHFEVRGAEAQALFAQFHSEQGLFTYKDEAQTFAIHATPERFVMWYDESGI